MNQRLEHQNSKVVGWYCSIYNLYNDILTVDCRYCNEIRPESLAVLSNRTKWQRTGWLTEAKELRMAETERELHAEFFLRWQDEERQLCDSMNDEQLTAHRNELARIALESKVRTTTADEVIRVRKAKKTTEGKTWLLPSESDYDATIVKERKARMSKMDKTLAMMKDLGVEGAEDIIANLAKKESGGSITSAPSRILVDKSTTQPTLVKSNNTQGNLLADITESLIAGIITRPINDLVNAAKTAGHIANKILGPEPKNDEPFDFTKLGKD